MPGDPETLTALGSLTAAIQALTKHVSNGSANSYAPYTGFSQASSGFGAAVGLGAQVGGAVGGQAGGTFGAMLAQMFGSQNPQLFGQLTGGYYQNSHFSAITNSVMQDAYGARAASLAAVGANPMMAGVLDMFAGAGTSDRLLGLNDSRYRGSAAAQFQGASVDQAMRARGMAITFGRDAGGARNFSGNSVDDRTARGIAAGMFGNVQGSDAVAAVSMATLFGRGDLDARTQLGASLAKNSAMVAGMAFGGNYANAQQYLLEASGGLSAAHLNRVTNQTALLGSLAEISGDSPEQIMQISQSLGAREGSGAAGGMASALLIERGTAYLAKGESFNGVGSRAAFQGVASQVTANLGGTLERQVLNAVAASGDKRALAAYRQDPSGFSRRYAQEHAQELNVLGGDQGAGAETGLTDIAAGAAYARDLKNLSGTAGGSAFVAALRGASASDLEALSRGRGRLAVAGAGAGLGRDQLRSLGAEEAISRGQRGGVGEAGAEDIKHRAEEPMAAGRGGSLTDDVKKFLSGMIELTTLFADFFVNAGYMRKTPEITGAAPAGRSP